MQRNLDRGDWESNYFPFCCLPEIFSPACVPDRCQTNFLWPTTSDLTAGNERNVANHIRALATASCPCWFWPIGNLIALWSFVRDNVIGYLHHSLPPTFLISQHPARGNQRTLYRTQQAWRVFASPGKNKLLFLPKPLWFHEKLFPKPMTHRNGISGLK